MDIGFYVLLTLASMVLLLAMWACSSHGVQQWGPDLTMELPPYLLQEALFPKTKTTMVSSNETIPSAPTEMAGAPLLSYAESPGRLDYPPRPPRPTGYPPKPPQTILKNSQLVRVLPPEFVQQHKLKPIPHSFVFEKKPA